MCNSVVLFANYLKYQYSYVNLVVKKGVHVTEHQAEYETNTQVDVGQVVQQLTDVEGEEQAEVFSEILNEAEPGTIALVLESLPLDERYERWQQVEFSERVTVLSLMRADPRMGILQRMPNNEVDLLFAQLSPEDLIEWSDYLPESFTDRALAQMGSVSDNVLSYMINIQRIKLVAIRITKCWFSVIRQPLLRHSVFSAV